ncbi:MAG TPA: hypothetical protein VGK64_09005 [Bryobacteraceae bacterium]
MGKPKTLLEGLCGHVLALGAESIEVEYDEGYEWVYARHGPTSVSIAKYKSGSDDARELRGNLYAAAKKPVRTVLNGQRSTLRVRIHESFGENAFDVEIEKAPPLNPLTRPSFTAKQGQYLAYIHHYSKIHRQAPSEAEMQEFFRVSPTAVHDMIKTLELNGFIERTPGMARSIRLLVLPERLPPLK